MIRRTVLLLSPSAVDMCVTLYSVAMATIHVENISSDRNVNIRFIVVLLWI